MAQRQTLAWSQLKVGLLVIVAFATLSAAILQVGGQTRFFGKTITVKAYFPSANGLAEGAEVFVDGIRVGNVEAIQFNPQPDPLKKVIIPMTIDEKFKDMIRTDSEIGVATIGLLGEKSVQLSSGSDKGKPVGDGGSVYGKNAGDISRIIDGADNLVLNLNKLSETAVQISDNIAKGQGTLGKFLSSSEIHDNLNKTVVELHDLVQDVRTGPGTMGKLITDDTLLVQINATLERVNGLLDKVDHGDGSAAKLLNDPALFNKADSLLTRFDNIAATVERGEGSLGRIIKEDGLYNDIHNTMTKLDTLIDAIQNGNGTAGLLIKDPSLFNSLSQASSEMQKLMYDIRQNPKKYLTINFRFF
jgi:phospholipid/cholesterol/gamma-HCH transport system substrate-binding protein